MLCVWARGGMGGGRTTHLLILPTVSKGLHHIRQTERVGVCLGGGVCGGGGGGLMTHLLLPTVS